MNTKPARHYLAPPMYKGFYTNAVPGPQWRHGLWGNRKVPSPWVES